MSVFIVRTSESDGAFLCHISHGLYAKDILTSKEVANLEETTFSTIHFNLCSFHRDRGSSDSIPIVVGDLSAQFEETSGRIV